MAKRKESIKIRSYDWRMPVGSISSGRASVKNSFGVCATARLLAGDGWSNLEGKLCFDMFSCRKGTACPRGCAVVVGLYVTSEGAANQSWLVESQSWGFHNVAEEKKRRCASFLFSYRTKQEQRHVITIVFPCSPIPSLDLSDRTARWYLFRKEGSLSIPWLFNISLQFSTSGRMFWSLHGVYQQMKVWGDRPSFHEVFLISGLMKIWGGQAVKG